MEINEARLNMLLDVFATQKNKEEIIDSYEKALRKNNLIDELFVAILRYDVNKNRENLIKIRKIVVDKDITIANFIEHKVSFVQLAVLMEEVEYELKNSMHLVSKPEEYAYYDKMYQDIIKYADENLTGNEKAYILIRMYKIVKLVLNRKQLANHYEKIVQLYDILNTFKFDYFQFKLNKDLIEIADYQNRFENPKSRDWKQAVKRYRADEQALTFLLSLHPEFSTKGFLIYSCCNKAELDKFMLDNIFVNIGFEEQIIKDIFEEYRNATINCDNNYYNICNLIILKLLNEKYNEIKLQEGALTKVLLLIKKMRDFDLNHYDTRYILEYQQHEMNYELELNRLLNKENAEKLYEEKNKKYELLKKFLDV